MLPLEIDAYCRSVLVALAKFAGPASWYEIEKRLHVPSGVPRGYLPSALASLVDVGFIEAVLVAGEKQPNRHQVTVKGREYLQTFARSGDC